MIETNTMVGTGMKIICQREELSQKLAVVARAVSSRASVQILSGVLLRAEAGRLHLAATDMELSLPAHQTGTDTGVPSRLKVVTLMNRTFARPAVGTETGGVATMLLSVRGQRPARPVHTRPRAV